MKYNVLKELCDRPGVPGKEGRVRDYIKHTVKSLVDDMFIDDMGNLHCIRYSDQNEDNWNQEAPVVMIACHMDEIGFIVNYIDDEGFISVQPLGGFDPRNLFSRRVKVVTDDSSYKGVMNPEGLPIHLSKAEDRKNVPAADEFIIDIGLGDATAEVIAIGDFVVMDEPFIEMGHKLVSKALDNRVACYMGIELLNALQGVELTSDVHVVFTVQEEVGLRGAKTAAMIVQPDVSIGVDVTLACDTPGVPAKKHVTKQGAGCAIGVRDSSFISDAELVKHVKQVADWNGIPYQLVVSAGGGMDGAAMQQAGVGSKAIAISVGTRYIHTVTEMVDKRDLDAALDLLVAVVIDL